MKCSACQFENPPGMRFCGQCGATLALRCPQCGAEAPAGFKFCGQCGASLQARQAAAPGAAEAAQRRDAPIPAYTPRHLADKILRSRSSLEGERRQVTVLFADVAGFTALAERMDPEEVHRIINRCFEAISAEVHRLEGTINQYRGDGVMALFGAPIAHEDSPRRAAYAALGIQQAVGQLSRELQQERDLTLQMRIGLNTGPVVVGKIGDDLRMDYTAVGDTTNLAARLEQMARPGSVLVSESTHNAIAGFFETRDLGELQLKGHAPVRAWEVLKPRGKRTRIEVALERGLSAFVGRERELATLTDRFAEVRQGRGQVVFLAGEAGIGKSRLLLELRRRIAEGGDSVTWLEGQCVSFGQSIPFLPILDQLRRNFGIEEFDAEPDIIAKVEQGMRGLGPLDAHIPFIRYMLSVDPGDPTVTAIDPAARRKKMFEAVRALTVQATKIRPLVLVVEDLHWMDSSSEELLGGLMDSLAAIPVMMILTYRVGYTPPFPTRSFSATINLTSLSDRESLALAGSLLGNAQLPAELQSALLQKAEGVPLFVEEVTKTLLDLGVLRLEGEQLVVARSMADVNVPDTIQGIIMARLDRLGDEGKRTVQLASVIGRQFLVRLLDRVAGMADRLDHLLHELLSLEIIYEQSLMPEPAYVFKHAVIQDVAYSSLLTERRRELHRMVGHAIEEIYADRLAEHYEELAHHFLNGEQWPKAFDYLVRAGDRAKDAYANQLALDHYEKAMQLVARITPPVDHRRIMEIHRRRSQVWMLLTRYPEAIAESERMRDLARELGDRLAEGEALMDLAVLYWATFRVEDLPNVRSCATQSLAIARDTGDERLLARSLGGLGLVDQVDGRLNEADAKFTESLEIARARGFRDIAVSSSTWLGADANWRGDFRHAVSLSLGAEQGAAEIHDGFHELLALAFRCLALVGLGEYSAGLDVIRDGLAKSRERNNGFIAGRLTNSLGWLYQELGDFRRSLDCDREGIEIGQRVKNGNVEVSSLINLAYDHLHLGQPQRALQLLEETAVRVEKFGFGAHRWRWTNHLTAYIAEALLAIGDAERAHAQADIALRQAQAIGSMKYVSKGHALRGEAALRLGQWTQAESELRQALAVSRQIGYPTLTWQSADLLAQALRAQHRMDEALDTARAAMETIDWVASRVPEESLRQSFLGWQRVQGARETFDRLAQG